MVRASKSFLIALAAIGLALSGQPDQAVALGHHGGRMSAGFGFPVGFGAGVPNSGAALSSFGYYAPVTGYNFASVPLAAPVLVGQGGASATSGPALASAYHYGYGTTAGLASSGLVLSTAATPTLYYPSTATAPADPALAEYQAYAAYRASAAGSATGSALASASPAARIASRPDYRLAAASVGEAELATIAGYLGQFAGRPEFWQRAYNLFRIFAQYNPWFNLTPLLQGPLRPLLDDLFHQGQDQGGTTPGPGSTPEPLADLGAALAIQQLNQSIQRLDASVNRLEGRIRVIERQIPALAEGDVVQADADPDGNVTVQRGARTLEVPGPADLKAGDVVLEVSPTEIRVLRTVENHHQKVSIPLATPDEPTPTPSTPPPATTIPIPNPGNVPVPDDDGTIPEPPVSGEAGPQNRSAPRNR